MNYEKDNATLIEADFINRPIVENSVDIDINRPMVVNNVRLDENRLKGYYAPDGTLWRSEAEYNKYIATVASYEDVIGHAFSTIPDEAKALDYNSGVSKKLR